MSGSAFVIWGLDFFLSHAERSDTLSGRLPLWNLLFYFGSQAPWLGAGYGAFWSANNPDLLNIWFVLEWTPVQSHNGFVELFIQAGSVGLSLFIIILAPSFKSTLDRCLSENDFHLVAGFVFVVAFTLLGLTEAVFMTQNSIFTIIFLFVIGSSNKISELTDRRP